MITALIPISKKKQGNGYVYIAKISLHERDTEGCYKIGSTSNLYKRLQSLASRYGGRVDLISYGYAENKWATEKMIQKELSGSFWCGPDNNDFFWGSTEYFRFHDQQLQNAVGLLKAVTTSSDSELIELVRGV